MAATRSGMSSRSSILAASYAGGARPRGHGSPVRASTSALARQVRALHAGHALALRLVVQEDVALDDLARGEIAVLDPLAHVVLVDRLAEVAQVVRGQAPVGLGLRRCSADMSSWRGVAVRPICTASGFRVSTSDHLPQAERWHSSMTMWLK